MAKRPIPLDDFDKFEVDDSGQLYWDGKSVLLEQRVSLRTFELVIATIASLATAVAAVFPIGLHFGWW